MRNNFVRLGVAVYLISVVVFLWEFYAEVTNFESYYVPWPVHEIIEIIILIGFLAGFLLLWKAYRAGFLMQEKMKTQLKTAKGELQEALQLLFKSWDLSDAEKDVALLTIKGLSISEIANLRNTSEGTVKTQSSSIYKKAGVNSRSQLVSDVIEELLD